MRNKNLGNIFNFSLFCSFCIGIGISKFPSLIWIFSALFGLFFILSFYYCKRNKLFISDLALLFAIVCLAGFWYRANHNIELDQILGQHQNVRIKIVSLPQDKGNFNSAWGRILSVDQNDFRQKIRVRDYSKSLVYLDKYIVEGRISRNFFKQRPYYCFWIKSRSKVEKLPISLLDLMAQKSNNYLFDVFKNNCKPESARFLSAIFLGRRELLKEESIAFAKIGATHLLAISGLHLGLTALFLFFCFRIFGIDFYKRLFLTLIFLCFYTYLSGMSPSTLRALLMFFAISVGFFLKRKTDNLNTYGLAGMIILLIEPAMLFDVGFQLSFIAVLSIIIGFRIFRIKPISNPVLNYLFSLILCSLFVFIGLLPVISYYFGKIHILGLVYNLLLIPYFTLIVVVNFILMLLSPFTVFSKPIGVILSYLIKNFQVMIEFMGNLRFSSISFKFNITGLTTYYLSIIIYLFFKYYKGGRSGQPRGKAFLS